MQSDAKYLWRFLFPPTLFSLSDDEAEFFIFRNIKDNNGFSEAVVAATSFFGAPLCKRKYTSARFFSLLMWRSLSRRRMTAHDISRCAGKKTHSTLKVRSQRGDYANKMLEQTVTKLLKSIFPGKKASKVPWE